MKDVKCKLIPTTWVVCEYSEKSKQGEQLNRRFKLIVLQPESEEYPLMTEVVENVEGEDQPVRWYLNLTWEQLKFIGESIKVTNLELLMKTSIIWIIIGTFIGEKERAEEIFNAWIQVKKKTFFSIVDRFNQQEIPK